MSSLLRRLLPPLLILLLVSLALTAQLPRPIERSVIPELHLLARKSGYIFSGTVKAVEHIAPTGANSVAVIRVTFQVEKGYVGVRSG